MGKDKLLRAGKLATAAIRENYFERVFCLYFELCVTEIPWSVCAYYLRIERSPLFANAPLAVIAFAQAHKHSRSFSVLNKDLAVSRCPLANSILLLQCCCAHLEKSQWLQSTLLTASLGQGYVKTKNKRALFLAII